MQPEAPAGLAGGGTIGKASMDSMVSPALADLHMSSLMGHDQGNMLYGSINSPLRKTTLFICLIIISSQV